MLAVLNIACLCVINWLGGCILNTQRVQRSSYRCLGKSLQTCSVSPFIRMKTALHAVCLVSIMNHLPQWRWTPSLTWTYWCLSLQTRCSLHWPRTSQYPGLIQGRLVRKSSADYFMLTNLSKLCNIWIWALLGAGSQLCYAFVKILDVSPPALPTSTSLPSTAHAGNADMIQPGLIPLQPNLDFMDSFDPLQGISRHHPKL